MRLNFKRIHADVSDTNHREICVSRRDRSVKHAPRFNQLSFRVISDITYFKAPRTRLKDPRQVWEVCCQVAELHYSLTQPNIGPGLSDLNRTEDELLIVSLILSFILSFKDSQQFTPLARRAKSRLSWAADWLQIIKRVGVCTRQMFF